MDRQEQATYMPANWRGPDDSSATLQVAWNDDELLVAARVTDNAVHATRRSYAGECVELFLNMQHMSNPADTALGPHARQFFLNPPVEGEWPTGDVDAMESVEGGRLAARLTDDGYAFEAALPFHNLHDAGFVPRPGGVLGFLPTLCDFDEGEGRTKLVWTEAENEYLDTSTWGRLVLLPEGGVGGTGPTPTVISEWELDGGTQIPDLGPAGPRRRRRESATGRRGRDRRLVRRARKPRPVHRRGLGAACQALRDPLPA